MRPVLSKLGSIVNKLPWLELALIGSAMAFLLAGFGAAQLVSILILITEQRS